MFKKIKEFIKSKTNPGVEEAAKSNMKFFQWIQEFSKKIVTITFYMYAAGEVVSIALIILAYHQMGESIV